jgi:hypothetical protein
MIATGVLRQYSCYYLGILWKQRISPRHNLLRQGVDDILFNTHNMLI